MPRPTCFPKRVRRAARLSRSSSPSWKFTKQFVSAEPPAPSSVCKRHPAAYAAVQQLKLRPARLHRGRAVRSRVAVRAVRFVRSAKRTASSLGSWRTATTSRCGTSSTCAARPRSLDTSPHAL
eukprot:6213420-Pleurochrysis_carterae.AAC.1